MESLLCAGCTMQRLEEVMNEMGERIESEEDVLPLDVAELAALELGQLAVRSADSKGASSDISPLDHMPYPCMDGLKQSCTGTLFDHPGCSEKVLAEGAEQCEHSFIVVLVAAYI